MSPAEALQAQKEVTIKLFVLGRRVEASRALFQAAAFLNQGELMENERQSLHSMLDEELDMLATSNSLLKIANGL